MDETFSIIVGLSSIGSFIISIIALVKVSNMKKVIQKVEGDHNIQAGENVNL